MHIKHPIDCKCLKEISFIYRVIGNPKLLYGDFNEYYSAVKRIEGKEHKTKCKF